MLNYVLQCLPFIIVILAWAIRLEVKLAQIQTDLSWIKKEIPKCQRY